MPYYVISLKMCESLALVSSKGTSHATEPPMSPKSKS